MEYEIWGLFKVGSLKTIASKLAKCKFDIMAVKEVRWDTNVSVQADEYIYIYFIYVN
jgi:hypothetical protein